MRSIENTFLGFDEIGISGHDMTIDIDIEYRVNRGDRGKVRGEGSKFVA